MKRLISLVLSLAMIMSFIGVTPVAASADDPFVSLKGVNGVRDFRWNAHRKIFFEDGNGASYFYSYGERIKAVYQSGAEKELANGSWKYNAYTGLASYTEDGVTATLKLNMNWLNIPTELTASVDTLEVVEGTEITKAYLETLGVTVTGSGAEGANSSTITDWEVESVADGVVTIVYNFDGRPYEEGDKYEVTLRDTIAITEVADSIVSISADGNPLRWSTHRNLAYTNSGNSYMNSYGWKVYVKYLSGKTETLGATASGVSYNGSTGCYSYTKNGVTYTSEPINIRYDSNYTATAINANVESIDVGATDVIDVAYLLEKGVTVKATTKNGTEAELQNVAAGTAEWTVVDNGDTATITYSFDARPWYDDGYEEWTLTDTIAVNREAEVTVTSIAANKASVEYVNGTTVDKAYLVAQGVEVTAYYSDGSSEVVA
ncbi:MAG: hypothetical protein IKU87_01530, partial [Clostridia bacterium]|nr:hypothetical protein [Clostridia bacterium]